MQDPQNPSNIVAMRQYVASFSKNNSGSTDASEDINTPKNEALKTLSSWAVDQIISSLSIEGNKSADIFVIEYSDMECPFCMRQYHDTKLGSTLLAEYGDKVAFAFKNNRGVNHPGTEAKALAVLCAKKVWNDANYIAFYQAIMDGSTNISWVYDVTKLSDIAKELSLDMKKWQTCLDSKEMLATFEKETKEAQGFELGGTPGTLILNVKTGKYTTVEWAYPYQTFRSKIESLMK